MDVKKLIEDVISHLAENDSLSLIVPKLQVIAKLFKNEDFKLWIESEFIYGYKDEREVPDYRKISVLNVKASFLRHQGFGNAIQYSNFEIPIANLGTVKHERITNILVLYTVFEIEQILKENQGNIHLSLNHYEKLLIQNEILQDCEISNIYKIVSRNCFQKIINTSKAKLLDLFLELNESIFNNEINFNVMERKTKISQIVNQTINTGIYLEGNSKASMINSNILGGTQNMMSLSEKFKTQVLELLLKIEELTEDIDKDRGDIAVEVAKIKLSLEKDGNPSVIKSAFNAIKDVASSIVGNLAANKIIAIINNTLPKINF